MTTDTTLYRIDATDRRALKSADSIVFSFYQGEGYIRANRDADRTPDGFSGQRRIPVQCSVHDYSDPASTTEYTAFHMISSPGLSDSWQTIRNRIALGSTIHLLWIRNNQSETLDSVGYYRDELRLTVTTERGKSETYLVAVQVGPDNSARMVRVAGSFGLR
jgi:hypothetical protein